MRAANTSGLPRVSVVMPFRNAAPTLEEALDSVLSQRGVALDVWAVDDGSCDAGPARVAKLAAAHRRLHLVRTGGVGLARALDIGCSAGSDPLIARMDADDICLPERLAAQADAMRSTPELGALGTRVEAFPTDAVREGLTCYLAWQNGLVTARDHRDALFIEAPLCHPSVMLRREALQALGGYRSGPFPEDYDLWLRLAEAGWALAKLPRVLLRWRHHPGQTTFTDPRFSPTSFLALKAPHLARLLRASPRQVTIWGAGRTGKHLARALEPHGVRATRFVDIDPRKIGRIARGAPIVPPEAIARGDGWLVVAVGARGARDRVRDYLARQAFEEGRDFICAA